MEGLAVAELESAGRGPAVLVPRPSGSASSRMQLRFQQSQAVVEFGMELGIDGGSASGGESGKEADIEPGRGSRILGPSTCGFAPRRRHLHFPKSRTAGESSSHSTALVQSASGTACC